MRNIEHRYENGKPVTVRTYIGKNGKSHELRAWGHLSADEMDKKAGTDHIHIWENGDGSYGMHGMRENEDMYPHMPDMERIRGNKKDGLIGEARSILSGKIDKAAIEKTKSLQARYKETGGGFSDKRDEFERIVDTIFAKRAENVKEMKAGWDRAKAAKESICTRAESLSYSSYTRAANQEMKTLTEKWKSAGRASKEDEDRLWSRFSAAKTRLFERIKQEREKRDADQRASKSRKESIISRASSLIGSVDYKSASAEMKRLSDEFYNAGSAGKDENQRLKDSFNRVKQRFYENAAAQREAKQREYKSRLREAKSRKEDALYRARQSLSNVTRQLVDLANRKEISWSNPKRWEIAQKRLDKESSLRSKQSSLYSRISDLERQISELNSKLNE